VRLVLARHGQTPSNVRRVLDSRPPGPSLTALGRAQAAALGERLAGWDVTAVHASRAVRARETAGPVAAAHGLAVDVVDGVHEVDCGDLEGRADPQARARFDAVYAAWWSGDLDARLPGGESALDLRARYLPVVERVTAGAAGTVVLVSHGAAMRVAAGALLGDGVETQYVPNTGLVVLTPAGAGWSLEHWDTPDDLPAPATPASDTPAAG
jgi:probable phosphoglycerate mutase